MRVTESTHLSGSETSAHRGPTADGGRPDASPAQPPALTTERGPAALVSLRPPAQEVLDATPRERDVRSSLDEESAGRRRTAAQLIGLEVDVRGMTPREATEVGLRLYAEGLVSWDEYAEFAFQPELHPDYNATIGALLGETAAPDAPRDFIQQWDERLAYEQRYNAIDSSRVRSTQRIAQVLTRLAGDQVKLDA